MPIRAVRQAEAGPHTHSRQRDWPPPDGDGSPITATVRDVPPEVILDVDDGMRVRCAVNLHNALTVSQQRLGKRIASLSPDDLLPKTSELKKYFGISYHYASGLKPKPSAKKK